MQNKKLQTLIESNKNLTVLYVEDSDIVRESTFHLLEDFFSKIDLAKNGEEGLQKYEKYYNLVKKIKMVTSVNFHKKIPMQLG